MPRRLRSDYPGAIHHVMNQGNGRRPIFESRRDVRYFLSLVARCVRRGQIQVLAYALMTTHFHLLVRSPEGELSRSLQWIQGMYARYFNRTRAKHGSSYRGRFRSKLVRSRAYLWALIWYIDRNPVEALLVASPDSYPYGSAWHYARRRRGPPWLERSIVESLVCSAAGLRHFEPAAYVDVACARASAGLVELVERATASTEDAPLQHLDGLVGAAPEHVQRWLADNAANADRAGSGRLVASSAAVRTAVGAARVEDPERCIGLTRKSRLIWPLLEAGLLHSAAGCSMPVIAGLQDASVATVHARVRAHRQAMADCTAYSKLAGVLLHQALHDDLGPLAARIPKERV